MTVPFALTLLVLGQVYHWVDARGADHYTDDLASVPKGVKVTTAEGEPISVLSAPRPAKAPTPRPSPRPVPEPAPARPSAKPTARDDAEADPTVVLGPLPEGLRPGDDEVLGAAVDAARRSPRLRAFGGLRATVVVDIIARADDPRLRGTPEWAGGFTTGPKQVYLLSPYIGAYSGGQPRPWKEMALHEVAHAQEQQWSGKARVPRWFREGYAMYVAEEQPGASRADVAWWAIRHGHGAPLSNTWDDPLQPGVKGHFGRRDLALYAYATCLAGLQFLTQTVGEAAVGQVLRELHEGATFEASFQTATGSSVADFEKRFLASLQPDFYERD